MKKAFAVILLVLLSSCGLFADTGETPSKVIITAPPEPTDAPPGSSFAPVQSGDGRFSLRYNSSATLNPLVGTDSGNMALSTLMYEGLFRLTGDFEYEYALCESFKTSDCITYDFTLRDGVHMSDGAELSAYDVVYSVNAARNNRYSSRLKNIESVSVRGAYVVRIVLKEADARFQKLLDFGIIKDGSSGISPPGTGPYKYAELGKETCLIKNDYHERANSLPVNLIYLTECAETELGERFTESAVDLFIDDPNATVVSVRRDHETRYYNTTVLQYIGFSSRTSVVLDPRFRAVVQYAVDKDLIVSDTLGARASVATLALPTYYGLYDSTWENKSDINAFVAMSELLGEMGMRDADNDTYLEYPLMGEYVDVSPVFLVNSENAARVEAAKSVADRLQRVGLGVELRELPYNEYIEALETGDFDMYYGETLLPANFDFSELISPGGALDYGGMATERYAALNSAFVGAWGDFAEKNAARVLCKTLADELPFVPVAYKQYAVHSGRNEISELEPTQTGLFWNIYDWTIDVK